MAIGAIGVELGVAGGVVGVGAVGIEFDIGHEQYKDGTNHHF